MNLSKIFEGKKFMWDGQEYKSEKEANEVMDKYKNDGFETYLYKENDKFYVFTRRVVCEVKVES